LQSTSKAVLSQKIKLSPWTKDITGQVFNNLTAVGISGNRGNSNSVLWNFLCVCGNITEQVARKVTKGNVKSCGCLKSKAISDAVKRHGMTGTREHKSWVEAKARCFYEGNQAFKRYGGAGITMDKEFAESFEAFFAYMGKMPSDRNDYSLGRIDNDKGYVKGNLRWETPADQARNRGKFKHNTSGFTGVNWSNKEGHLYSVCTWYDLSGKKLTKNFAVSRYGLIPAFHLACDYRTKMIEELNKQGAGYSASHGK